MTILPSTPNFALRYNLGYFRLFGDRMSRPKGSGYDDQRVLLRMAEAVVCREARSPWEAAHMFAGDAEGASDEAKIRRIHAKYKKESSQLENTVREARERSHKETFEQELTSWIASLPLPLHSGAIIRYHEARDSYRETMDPVFDVLNSNEISVDREFIDDYYRKYVEGVMFSGKHGEKLREIWLTRKENPFSVSGLVSDPGKVTGKQPKNTQKN